MEMWFTFEFCWMLDAPFISVVKVLTFEQQYNQISSTKVGEGSLTYTLKWSDDVEQMRKTIDSLVSNN